VCPVHLEGADVVGSLSSVTEVPSVNLPGDCGISNLRSVSDNEVDVTLCNVKPRVKTLLRSVPINWQRLSSCSH